MGLFISYSYFIKGFLCTGDGDVGEIVLLVEHPVLRCEFARHPGIATEEVDSGPFETFGFVDGRECEFGWGFGIVVGEELFEGLVEEGQRGDVREREDGSDGGSFVLENFELVSGEFEGLVGEVLAEGEGEGGFVSGFELFAEANEFLANVFALNAAGNASVEEFEGEGDEWCVLAAKDRGGLIGVGGAMLE